MLDDCQKYALSINTKRKTISDKASDYGPSIDAA